MKQILAVGCATVFALIVMDASQVVKTPCRQALAADMPMPPPPPVYAAPVGKGKAPIGKGKSPIVVTRG